MRHALAALLLLVACNAPSDPPAPAAPEILQVETAPGVTLHVEKYGDGPNVVIVPGRLFMGEDMARLAAPDRTLLLYDMRNRGASSRVADTAVLNVVEDVRDVEALRAHFGAERISLVGYSYLGLMVALYAAEHPDRVERLVQIGPVQRSFATEYPPNLRAGEESLSAEARAANAEAEQALAAAPDMPQAERCRVQRRALALSLVGNPANAARVPDTCVYENEWPEALERHFGAHFTDIQQREFPAARFTALTQPVLIIHGTLDRNAPYGSGREWTTTFPDARLITVQGGAHSVWFDDSAVVSDIDTFLRGDWPARAEEIS